MPCSAARAWSGIERLDAHNRQRPLENNNRKRNCAEPKPAAADTSGSDSAELDAIGKARIGVATKLRDGAHQLYQGGQINVEDYLTAQKRYDEVVADVTVKTEADRVRFLEREVATLKQIEDVVRGRFRNGNETHGTVLMTELARLDAEYAAGESQGEDSKRLKVNVCGKA